MSDVSAVEIVAALKNKYSYPEWVGLPEVPNGTGSASRRRADFIAYNLYPSKNYCIHGFEVKVSRSDLLNELKDGGKSDSIAKYCDAWFLVVPKDLVKETDEVPDTWGIYEYNNGALRLKRKGEPLLNKWTIDRTLTAALLQATCREKNKVIDRINNISYEENYKKIQEEVDKTVEKKLTYYRGKAEIIGRALDLAGISEWQYDRDTDFLAKRLKLAFSINEVYLGGILRDMEDAEKQFKAMREIIQTLKAGGSVGSTKQNDI